MCAYVHFGHQGNIAGRSAFRASHAGNGPPWAVRSKFSLLGLIKQWPTRARARRGPSRRYILVCLRRLTPRERGHQLCYAAASTQMEIQTPWRWSARNDKRAMRQDCARFILIWLAPNRPRNLRRFCPLGATGGTCKSHFLIRIRPWQLCRVSCAYACMCMCGVSSYI
jgi:hypothetical protein